MTRRTGEAGYALAVCLGATVAVAWALVGPDLPTSTIIVVAVVVAATTFLGAVALDRARFRAERPRGREAVLLLGAFLAAAVAVEPAAAAVPGLGSGAAGIFAYDLLATRRGSRPAVRR